MLRTTVFTLLAARFLRFATVLVNLRLGSYLRITNRILLCTELQSQALSRSRRILNPSPARPPDTLSTYHSPPSPVLGASRPAFYSLGIGLPGSPREPEGTGHSVIEPGTFRLTLPVGAQHETQSRCRRTFPCNPIIALRCPKKSFSELPTHLCCHAKTKSPHSGSCRSSGYAHLSVCIFEVPLPPPTVPTLLLYLTGGARCCLVSMQAGLNTAELTLPPVAQVRM